MIGSKKLLPINNIRKHPQYNMSSLEYDIAILTLTEALDFNVVLSRPICLPSSEEAGAQVVRAVITHTSRGQLPVLKQILVQRQGTGEVTANTQVKVNQIKIVSSRMLSAIQNIHF